MVPGPRSRTQGPFADERLAARAWAAKSDTGRDDAHRAIVARPVDATDRSAPSGLEWRTLRRWRTPDSLLLPIAHAITGFLTSEDLTRVNRVKGHLARYSFLTGLADKLAAGA